MNKPLRIALPLLAFAIGAVAVANRPTRFRLQSASPSGKTRVVGLRFQGRNPHPLDGTLRLFVSQDQTHITRQTSLAWDRDLAIVWKDRPNEESFAIQKDGQSLMEFQMMGTDLNCLKGQQHLAADPANQSPP